RRWGQGRSGDGAADAGRERADACRERWISWKFQKQMVLQNSNRSRSPAANEVIAQTGKTEKWGAEKCSCRQPLSLHCNPSNSFRREKIFRSAGGLFGSSPSF